MIPVLVIACTSNSAELVVHRGFATVGQQRADLADQGAMLGLVADLSGPVKRRRPSAVRIEDDATAVDVARALEWILYADETPVSVDGVEFAVNRPLAVDACDLTIVYVSSSGVHYGLVKDVPRGYEKTQAVAMLLQRAPPTCGAPPVAATTCERSLLVATDETTWADLRALAGRFSLIPVRRSLLDVSTCPSG